MQRLKQSTIVYILAQYPSCSEVFIHSEIEDLLAAGLNITLLALKRAPQIGNKSTVAITYDAFFMSPAKLMAHLYVVYRHPQRYIRTLIAEFKIRKISWLNFLRLLRDFSSGVYFFRRISQHDVKHIHAHFISWPANIARILAGLCNKKFSCTAHANDIYTTGSTELMLKLRQAAFVITCTRYNEDYLRRLTDSERMGSLIHIYHGLDLKKWTRQTPKRFFKSQEVRILSIGRLVEKKGLIYLLKAILLLKKENIKVSCEIIGQGPLYEEFDRFIHDEGIVDCVRLHGAVAPAGIKAFYEEADVFILPCIIAGNGDRDGLPNVLLEALAMEIPVITTSISAITELIQDNVTGLLVMEKSPESIVKALKTLLDSPHHRDILISNGRYAVRSYDLSASTSYLKKIFTEL